MTKRQNYPLKAKRTVVHQQRGRCAVCGKALPDGMATVRILSLRKPGERFDSFDHMRAVHMGCYNLVGEYGLQHVIVARYTDLQRKLDDYKSKLSDFNKLWGDVEERVATYDHDKA